MQDLLVSQIIEHEWPMFRVVNGDDRVNCQDNRPMFVNMRTAQFAAWSEEAQQSYLHDLEEAEKAGRNLLREKYIRMMESTDPRGFRALRDTLPPLSEEQEALVSALWALFERETSHLRADYPVLALGGRPLYASEESGDDTSIQTYQCGEFKTYSAQTLRLLLKHAQVLEAEGRELVRQIQLNTVRSLGYATLEEAETAMGQQLQFRGGPCASCH